MKILHIIDHLGLGGAQAVVGNILESQKGKNKDIFLFVLRKKKANININNKNVYVFNSNKKYSLKPINELKSLIKKEKIDILHCHLFRSQFFGYILKKIYFPNIKLIFHEHGEIFRKKWYSVTFLRLAKKDVNLFIAVSKVTKEKLIKYAGINSNKIRVLYNFINLDKFNPKALGKYNRNKEKGKLGIKRKDFVIGFVGHLNKIKGCEYLIKSIFYIQIPNFKVVIAGDGQERKNLENLCREFNIQDKIIFLGYIENTLSIYSIIDVLVVPSIFESFGIVVLEAQASGIPVVAAKTTGLTEIITDKESGLLFKLKNCKDLAKKIGIVFKDDELRGRLIDNSLESVGKYNLDIYLRKLDSLYK
jgi:L-malate glycosyltransferase